MKTLYLVRHAKSSWDNPNWDDFERPLNERGLRSAPKMARYLVNKGIKPQQMVASPAARALSTAHMFAAVMGYPANDIVQVPAIYNSNRNQLFDILRQLDDNQDSIMLFGHDTSITIVTEDLSNQRFLHFPTCGVAGLKLNINSWADVKEGCGELEFFYFPKGIADELKLSKKAPGA